MANVEMILRISMNYKRSSEFIDIQCPPLMRCNKFIVPVSSSAGNKRVAFFRDFSRCVNHTCYGLMTTVDDCFREDSRNEHKNDKTVTLW